MRKGALAGLGIVFAVLLLEGGLRAASLFVEARPVPAPDGRLAVLCVGDSNTYGPNLRAEEAYPAKLQAVLDRRAAGRYRVLNLGLPGMSSTEVAARLPGWLAVHRPAFVVASVGINNLWNTTPSSPLDGLRIVRLARVLSFALGERRYGRPEITRVVKDGGRGGEAYHEASTGRLLVVHRGDLTNNGRTLQEARELLASDVSRMAEMSKAGGAKLVLLGYAAAPVPGVPASMIHEPSHLMTETLHGVALARALDFRDPRPLFAALVRASGSREAWFQTEDDGHPNARGNEELARLVSGALP